MTTRLDKPTRLSLATAGLAVTELLARQMRVLRDRGEIALKHSPLRPRTRDALARYREAGADARRVLGRPATPGERLQRAIVAGAPLQPTWLPAGCVLLPLELAVHMQGAARDQAQRISSCAAGMLLDGDSLGDDWSKMGQFAHDQVDKADALLDAARANRPTTALVPLDLLERAMDACADSNGDLNREAWALEGIDDQLAAAVARCAQQRIADARTLAGILDQARSHGAPPCC